MRVELKSEENEDYLSAFPKVLDEERVYLKSIKNDIADTLRSDNKNKYKVVAAYESYTLAVGRMLDYAEKAFSLFSKYRTNVTDDTLFIYLRAQYHTYIISSRS